MMFRQRLLVASLLSGMSVVAGTAARAETTLSLMSFGGAYQEAQRKAVFEA